MLVPERGLDVLSDEHVAAVHETAMRICEEIGIDVLHEGMRARLAGAGLRVDDARVRFDRGFVMERVAQAPSRFTLLARDPSKAHEVGGPTPLWMNVGGPPFASDLDGGRRSGSLTDHDALVKLTHAAGVLNGVQTGAVEAMELDVHTRHLDMEYSTIRWSDEPYATYGTNGPKARDGIEMAAIVHRGRDAIERAPALVGIVNSNSPLVWDFKMVDALVAWAEANQAIAVTPFLLAGATAPVSVAGGLAQQVAECLTGVAMAQLVRPGTSCLYGSFFTAIDMRSGAPAFGTPESILGVLAGGQLARHYGLPYRGGGGLASSNTVDAQAAAESALMLWATVLSGADVVLHAAGWLEGGLTASFEKFALDLELLEGLATTTRGIGFTDEELAFDALKEVGPGGLWLASEHTMAHFKEWLTMSPLFTTPDVATWEAAGAPDAHQRALERWKALLAAYEDPGLDEAVDEELRAFIERRKREPVPSED